MIHPHRFKLRKKEMKRIKFYTGDFRKERAHVIIEACLESLDDAVSQVYTCMCIYDVVTLLYHMYR